jgi:hypothetical protein
MTPNVWLAVLGLTLASACRTPGAPSSGQAIASTAQTVPSGAGSPVASAVPLRLGSAPTGTKDERERALLGFLESGQAAQIEVVATEPGVGIDYSLRQSLLGHVVEASAPVVRGNAQVGAATATGGEISNLNRVVAGMRAGFRNCYQRALADAPHYAGKLDLKLTVDVHGGVATAKVTSPQRNAAVFACVEARAKASQFDPPGGGKPATVRFSVTLSKP